MGEVEVCRWHLFQSHVSAGASAVGLCSCLLLLARKAADYATCGGRAEESVNDVEGHDMSLQREVHHAQASEVHGRCLVAVDPYWLDDMTGRVHHGTDLRVERV